MFRTQWKVSALFLTTILISILILTFTTPLFGEVLAQKTVRQCGISPSDWSFQAAQSLVKKYGVDICERGNYRVNEMQTRADMASLLAPTLESVYKLNSLSAEKLPKKSELDSLNQLLDQITAHVEALER